MSTGWLVLLVFAIVALGTVLGIPGLRRRLLAPGLMAFYRSRIPPMSQTEREAIEAGTVWWDGALFSGHPDFDRLLSIPRATLSPEEQSFLDN
ncbi:MAG TPA: hypothetical protein VIU29_09515, partial [Candidatus Deferrimicrobiaceae bacterium]